MSAPTLPNFSELTPAYGRSYTRSQDVRADFLAGRDFTLAATGQKTSLRDVTPGTQIMLRYRRNQSVVIVKVTKAHIEALASQATKAGA
jgi:hypothetical protein